MLRRQRRLQQLIATPDFSVKARGKRPLQALAGTSPFALSYDGQARNFGRTELGARLASHTYLPDGTRVTLQSRAAWAHDFNTDVGLTASFQSLPGAAFSVAAARPAADAALVSAGAEMQLTRNVSVASNVEGEFSTTTTLYSGTLNSKVQW